MFIEKQNNKNYTRSINYYDEFYKIIKKYNLSKQLSDIESKEMYNKLMSGCYYLTTNDIVNDKN